MTRHHIIRNVLSTMYSTQSDRSWQEGEAALARSLRNPEWRSRLEAELVAAFSDPSTPWPELLFNDEYEVAETDTPDEARAFAAKLLWAPTFPNRPLPQP